jgi:hypothetical protein
VQLQVVARRRRALTAVGTGGRSSENLDDAAPTLQYGNSIFPFSI